MRRPHISLNPPELFVAAGVALPVAVGLCAMAGWLLGAKTLTQVLPGLSAVTPNAALCYILCGASLLLQCWRRFPGLSAMARPMACIAALVGFFTLVEHLIMWNTGLDLWLWLGHGWLLGYNLPYPGRMTPAASLIFLLVGIALAWLDFEPRRGFFPAQHAAALASFLGLLDIVGYIFAVDSRNGFYAHAAKAWHEAIVFTALALGVLMARPNQGLMSVVTRQHGGGLMMRRLLPAAVLLPLVLGWFLLEGEFADWYDTRIGLSLFVVANMITFTIILWFNARALNGLDETRRRAHEALVESERDLHLSNDRLREEVADHTRTEQARQRTERQLHQSQKMESLGTLASGIAHDFNNILTAIFLNAERGRKHVPEDSPARKNLEEIAKAGTRAADLVRRIMTFGRQAEPNLKTLPLRQAVEESLQLLRLSLPSGVDLRADLGAEASPVAADASQIHQIILNLGTNAIHAMEDRAGVLEVKMELVYVTPDLTRLLVDLREGPHVRLSIRDTGKGMDKAVLDRVFDPFFTTKAPGVGTGLGLSVVHGIMKQHGGCVTAYSEPGRGTLFHLYFPAAAAADGGKAYVRPESPHGNGERLLCVDDDLAILSATTEMLEGLGYRVKAFSDPRAALNAFAATPSDFDLVLTDLSMPGISGLEVARAVLEIRPDLPVVLMSGYIAPGDAESLRQVGVRTIIQKPNVLEELAVGIRDALAPAA